jgi:general secretion pathway protein D
MAQSTVMSKLNHSRAKQSLGAISVMLLVSGCATFPSLKTGVHIPQAPPAANSVDDMLRHPNDVDKLTPSEVFPVPASTSFAPKASQPTATDADIAALLPQDTAVEVALPPQPLPSFIDTIFGDILKVPYSVGPGVADRHEMVALRTPPTVTRRQLFNLTQMALKEEFGLNVYIKGGQVLIAESPEQSANSVSVIRGHSDQRPNTQVAVEFFQLDAIDVNSMQQLLQDLYGANVGVKIRADPATNTMIVAGPARTVEAAAQMLAQLDQPTFAGAQVARFEPVFWSADAFSKALGDVLTSEGYLVSTTPRVSRGLEIIALPTTNQVLVFAGTPELMSRVQFWAKELDQPNRVGDQKTTFVYVVKNTDAASIGALLTGQKQTSTPTTPVGVPGTPPSSSAGGAASPAGATTAAGVVAAPLAGGTPGQITVDTIGNRILYTGTAADFARLKSVLEQLDQPPKQVMIEVIVAEVTLTDQTNVGLEWFFSHAQGNQTFSGGTLGGLSIASNGFTLVYTGPNLQANFEAFASNNKVNILSRPRVVTKSGTEAQIQVGTDVPIITSQAAVSGVQTTTGATSVLQSVEYRQTGIILHVKPIVFGDNRVDLTVSQEVSDAEANSSAAIASPQILDRSIQTELSLTNGATAVLGGLMDDNYTKGNNGVPIIKDIPIIGEAARTDSISGAKTELVILVTPFIVNDADDMQGLANTMSAEINRAFKVGRGWSYTLMPFSTGQNFGLGIPPPRTQQLNPPPPLTPSQ